VARAPYSPYVTPGYYQKYGLTLDEYTELVRQRTGTASSVQVWD